jgi:hypothetical protein
MSDEQGAREQLIKNWATYPASDKTRCVQSMDYSPSYVEWLTCAEMARDVRKTRKEDAASPSNGLNIPRQSAKSRTGSNTKLCPIVQYAEDGMTIVSVNAC